MSDPEIWVDLLKEILGSREAVQAILQGSEYTVLRANSNVWLHFWGSVRRRREGIPHSSWEPMGGIFYNTYTRKLTPDMEQVPDELYQRAVNAAKGLATRGRLPHFDTKVLGPDWTYRMVAILEGQTHVLAFYRRPKYWPWN